MKKLLITALMFLGFLSSTFAQDEVTFTILKTNGSTTSFTMNRDARIYYSDTQLMFFDGNETVSINFSDIRKAYFSTSQDVNEVDNRQLSIYPNPAKNIVKITNIADNQEVILYSISGEAIKKTTASGEAEINISDLNAGIYIIGAGNMFTKFIKM